MIYDNTDFRSTIPTEIQAEQELEEKDVTIGRDPITGEDITVKESLYLSLPKGSHCPLDLSERQHNKLSSQ